MSASVAKKNVATGIRGLTETGGKTLPIGATIDGAVLRRTSERIESTGNEGPFSLTSAVGFGTGGQIWYGGTLMAGVSSFAPAIDLLHVHPFILSRTRTADRIAFYIPATVGGAGSKARCGIYRAKTASNIYPSALVVDGGEFDTSSVGGAAPTMKIATINTVLTGGVLYWFAYLCGTAAPTVSSCTQSGPSVGATAASLVNNSFLRVAQAYGALPDPFPAAAAAVASGTSMTIALRFST